MFYSGGDASRIYTLNWNLGLSYSILFDTGKRKYPYLKTCLCMEAGAKTTVYHWYPVTSLLRRPLYWNGLGSTPFHGPQAITGDTSDTDTIIILNGEQRHNLFIFNEIWTRACLKVAVDGGANFVMDQLGKAKPQWPDIITGDFDSIRSDVLTFCQEKGIPTYHTPDQNQTDFLKCVRIVIREIITRNLPTNRILVFGAYGGRLDHVFANVNTLTIARDLTSIPIYLLDDNQQAFLLCPGEHHIHISEPDVIKWCGLVPVSQPVTSKTTGLKWNLDGEVMRYGAIISTSNKVTEKIVTITCDGALLWMMGFCSTEEL